VPAILICLVNTAGRNLCLRVTFERMAQVLDEIGVDITAQMGSAPAKKAAVQQKVSAPVQDEDDSLTARLAALK
jgi:hypothetical protein